MWQGPPGALHALAPNLAELDLGSNLFPSWGEVGGLARELPHLHALDVTGNRMAFPASPTAARFSALRTLVLNRCCIGWQQARAAFLALLQTVLPRCLCLCKARTSNFQCIGVQSVSLLAERKQASVHSVFVMDREVVRRLR